MYTSPIALLSQTEQLSSQRSQAIIKHAMAAIALVGVLAVAQPVWGQVLSGPGGGGGTGGGGLTGGIFLTGNTINSSSGVPADASLTISGLGGASVGMSGSVLLISGGAAGAATASLTALGNTTGLTSSQTQALTSGAISGAGIASVGYSNGTLLVSVTSAASGSVINLFALGNTTGATSSTTATLSQLSFSAAGGASLGYSTTAAGAGVIIVSAPTTVASATSGAQIAIGNTTGATSSESTPVTAFNVSGAGGDSVGFSLGTMIVSGQPASATSMGKTAIGNTTGLTSSQSQALTSAVYSGAGGVSLGYSNNTMIISGATGGGGGATISMVTGPVLPGSGYTSLQPGSEYMLPVVVPAALVLNQAHLLMQNAILGPAAGGLASSAASRTGSYGVTETVSMGLYSTTAASAFASFAMLTGLFAVNASLSESGTSWSATHSVTYPSGSVSASTTFSTTTASSSWAENNLQSLYASVGNQLRFDVAATAQSTINAGAYLAGAFWATATARLGAYSAAGITMSMNLMAGVAGISWAGAGLGALQMFLTDKPIGSTAVEAPWQIGSLATSLSASFSQSQISNFTASSYNGFFVSMGAS